MDSMTKAFFDQNPLSAPGLTEAEADFYVAEHSGGLVVLLRYSDGTGNLVKMHDSWGADDEIVVHRYDPDADDPQFSETEMVWDFTDAAEAFRFFKEV